MHAQLTGGIHNQTRLITALAILLSGFLLVATAGPPGAASPAPVAATAPASVTVMGNTWSGAVSGGESNAPRYRF
jgi:hypothetical protein